MKSIACVLLSGFIAAASAYAQGEDRVSETYQRQQMTLADGKKIQKALKEKGFYEGPVDGMLKDKSVEALQNFQRDQGIIANRPLSRATLEALGVQTSSMQAQEEL